MKMFGWVIKEGYTLEQALHGCPSQWEGLVREAFNKLPKGARIVQVKAKWGHLTIYWEVDADSGGIPSVEAEAYDKLLARLREESYVE